MAFTPGFKKLIGLVVVIAGVGGGLYAYKTMPHSKPVPATIEEAADAPMTIPQPTSSPIYRADTANQVVEQASQTLSGQPPTPSTPVDASANRGLKNLLNQGSK